MLSSLRPHPGRRARHALLAAEPQALRQAGAQRGGRTLADSGHGGPAGAADSRPSACGSHQRSPARRPSSSSFRRSRGIRFWPNRRSATRRPPSAWRRRSCTRSTPKRSWACSPRPRGGQAGAYRAVVSAALQGRRRGPPDGGGHPAALAGNRLRLRRVPAGTAPAAGNRCPSAASTRSPTLARAKRYVAAGNFYWNSGMFFWRAGVLLDELRQHLPKTATMLASLPPLRARISPPVEAGVSAVREHLDRFRRAGKIGQMSAASPPPISAGTTWEAGTPSTSCWPATARAIPRPDASAWIRARQFRGRARKSGGAAGRAI
jgi:hypothetical protein